MAEQNAAIRAAKGLPSDNKPVDSDDDPMSGCLLTVEQVAEMIGMSRRYVRDICAKGRIAGVSKRSSDGAWIIPYDGLKNAHCRHRCSDDDRETSKS